MDHNMISISSIKRIYHHETRLLKSYILLRVKTKWNQYFESDDIIDTNTLSILV